MSEYKKVIDKLKKEEEEKEKQNQLKKKYKVPADEQVILKEKNVLPILIFEKIFYLILILLASVGVYSILDIELRNILFLKVNEIIKSIF